MLGVPLSVNQVGAFERFLAELERWNRRINLTAIRTPTEIVIHHFLDSLAGVRLLPEGPADLLDIGSGGGFPGVPLALIRSDLKVTLLEPRKKKAAFLHHLVGTLPLPGATVIDARLEEITTRHDLAVTRAVRPTPDFVHRALSVTRDRGRLVIWAGRPETIPSLEFGAWSVRRVLYRLPFAEYERVLLVFERTN